MGCCAGTWGGHEGSPDQWVQRVCIRNPLQQVVGVGDSQRVVAQVPIFIVSHDIKLYKVVSIYLHVAACADCGLQGAIMIEDFDRQDDGLRFEGAVMYRIGAAWVRRPDPWMTAGCTRNAVVDTQAQEVRCRRVVVTLV